MTFKKWSGAAIVLLGKYELPSHSARQLGKTLDVFFDRLFDKTARVQIRLRFGQRGLQFALAQVCVLFAAHHHVFGLTSNRQGHFGLIRECTLDCADALGFQVIR